MESQCMLGQWVECKVVTHDSSAWDSVMSK
jgi:hypothetical protein